MKRIICVIFAFLICFNFSIITYAASDINDTTKEENAILDSVSLLSQVINDKNVAGYLINSDNEIHVDLNDIEILRREYTTIKYPNNPKIAQQLSNDFALVESADKLQDVCPEINEYSKNELGNKSIAKYFYTTHLFYISLKNNDLSEELNKEDTELEIKIMMDKSDDEIKVVLLNTSDGWKIIKSEYNQAGFLEVKIPSEGTVLIASANTSHVKEPKVLVLCIAAVLVLIAIIICVLIIKSKKMNNKNKDSFMDNNDKSQNKFASDCDKEDELDSDSDEDEDDDDNDNDNDAAEIIAMITSNKK